MRYKIKGYAIVGEERKSYELNDGIIVKSWDEAHELMEQAGFDNYLITISPIDEDE